MVSLAELQQRLIAAIGRQSVILPEDANYETVRFSYNLMHDRRPGLIVRTLDVEALRKVLELRREYSLELAVRGGGHHIGGFSTTEGGILIDFSTFREVRFEPQSQTVVVQPGARLGDLDALLTGAGRCLPSGTVSDTGITGLTLGGGIGWLVGSCGLTCDYLQGVRVLLDDGRVIDVDDESEPELMAAYRGSGMGGFGLILQLRYQTIPLPTLVAGSVHFAGEEAIEVLNIIGRSHALEQYRVLSLAPVLRRGPAGIDMSVDLCSVGADDQELTRLRKEIGGDWSGVVEVSYPEWQSRFDSSFLPPKRGYWKSTHFADAALDFGVLKEVLDNPPSVECSAMVEFYNRDVLRSRADGSFYPLRDSMAGILLTGRWDDPRRDAEFASWVGDSAALIARHGAVGGYSNYSDADEELVLAGYRAQRLETIRGLGERYDPSGVFAQGHRRRLKREREAV